RAALDAEWHKLTGSDVPEGFAMTNGRVEATKVYITTKYQGRIEEVLVREGDTIDERQVLARMDTRTLKAHLRQGDAESERARDTTATAVPTVARGEAGLDFWNSEVERERKLIAPGATSRTAFEGVVAKAKAATAMLQGAKSQVVEAQAAIDAAV